MYVVYNKDHIHNLMNESKMLIFVYNSDWTVYLLYPLITWFKVSIMIDAYEKKLLEEINILNESHIHRN